MELSTEGTGSRIDREFCSNACKLRDHRAKVKRAKELSARGKTVAQIAKELKTTTESVRRWLTKTK